MKKDKKKIKYFIKDFFDIYNIKHIRAYKHLQIHGAWPIGFIPDDIEMENNWQMLIWAKMATAFVDAVLKGDIKHG